MYGTPATIMNAVAKSQKFLHAGLQEMFAMDEVQFTKTLNEQIDTLHASGVASKVALLYVKFAPLLAENEAISRYILESGDPSLRQILPEITSVADALRVAEMENPMSDKERSSLENLLVPLVQPLA